MNLNLENLPDEIWKAVKGFEGLYEVSNLGRVKSLERVTEFVRLGQIRVKVTPSFISKQHFDQDGYKRLPLRNCEGRQLQQYVHRLMAQAFIDNPDNLPVVNHKDLNKANNVISNLEWTTVQLNTIHAYENGAFDIKHNEEHHNSKLTWQLVNRIRQFRAETGMSYQKMEEVLGYSKSHIHRICTDQNWVEKNVN